MNRIGELLDEVQKISREQQKMENSLKINQQTTRKHLDEFTNNAKIIGVPEVQEETLMKKQLSNPSLLRSSHSGRVQAPRPRRSE